MLQPGEQFHYSQCFATGWGKDQFGAEGQFQVESLDRVQFKVFLCLKRFHKLRLAGGVEGDRSPNCGAWPM